MNTMSSMSSSNTERTTAGWQPRNDQIRSGWTWQSRTDESTWDTKMAVYIPWVQVAPYVTEWESANGATVEPAAKVEETKKYICETFRKLDIMETEPDSIELQAQFGPRTPGEKRSPFTCYRAQVWPQRWLSNNTARPLQQKILDHGSARIVHDDPAYWVLRRNQFATQNEFRLDKENRRLAKQVANSVLDDESVGSNEVMTAPVNMTAPWPKTCYEPLLGRQLCVHSKPPGRVPRSKAPGSEPLMEWGKYTGKWHEVWPQRRGRPPVGCVWAKYLNQFVPEGQVIGVHLPPMDN